MHAVQFESYLLAIAIIKKQIHVIVMVFVYKIHQGKSN